MPLEIVRNDITKMKVDAIVNAANTSLLGGGGVDGCIHRAAGKGILEECKTLGGCGVGMAKMTGAYKLPAKHVIHTVGPVWQGGSCNEESLLRSCYTESLSLALGAGCETVAFPLISSGIYGYPKHLALRVAVDTISEFLFENDMTVYIVIFDKDAYSIGAKLFTDIKEYIDDRYTDRLAEEYPERSRMLNIPSFMQSKASAPAPGARELWAEDVCECTQDDVEDALPCGGAPRAMDDLSSKLRTIDESFSQMLLRKIDEKGMTDAQCYKKANIDRKLFSKIRSDKNYKPSKPTAIAFAIALELPLSEAEEMLRKAGFALSSSNKFDIIIEYFISHGNYNVFEINEALFAFDQSLLGA